MFIIFANLYLSLIIILNINIKCTFLIEKGFGMIINIVSKIAYKMENTKYNTVRIIPESNGKMVQAGKIDTSNTHIQDCSLPGLIQALQLKKSGGDKLVLWALNVLLSKMI